MAARELLPPRSRPWCTPARPAAN